MVKKKAEAYNDVTELNWEETEPPIAGFRPIAKLDLNNPITVILNNAWTQIDPEIRKEGAIWHWALADDHITFIFRDGKKIRIEL